MAQLPPQTLTTIFRLQQQLVELVHDAKAAEFNLFETCGETTETIPELEQLQNATERLRKPYTRLHSLALAIAEAQPVAPIAMLKLLDRSIEETSAIASSVGATIVETKGIWNLQ
ncbi:MAG: hypothetical protein WCD18_06730 [Thermosynechococcaceae cyanobacterium]